MRSEALAATLLVVLILAGCATPAADPSSASLPAGTLSLEVTPVLGELFAEPAIAHHPDGAIFVAGYATTRAPTEITRPMLARSDDGGATWQTLVQGAPTDSAIGNSDTDLAISPDGTIYHATMLFFPWGHAISIGASKDLGATWTWRQLMVAPWVDRPWIEVGPDGTAHATWSSPRGLHHATSRDGGESWQEGPLVHPSSGSGGLAIGPNGEIAVRLMPYRGPTILLAAFAFLFVDPEADGIAVSGDGGATWEIRQLPGQRRYADELGRGGDQPRWSDPVAFDAVGTLYTAWGEGDALQLAVSRDLGATWTVRTLSQTEGRVAFYPYLRAGAAGELAATWYTNGNDDLRAHVARVVAADGEAPRVDVRDAEPATDLSTAGEYFQATILPDGTIAAAMPLDTDEAATSGFAFLALRGALDPPSAA